MYPIAPALRRCRRAAPRFAVLVPLLLLFACGGSESPDDVRAMHAAGRYEESLEPLRALLEDNPDDPEVLYLYGVALTGVGQRTQAMWPLRRAMESPEWRTPAALHLANLAITTADWDMALAVLDPVLEREPENAEALLLRAYARAQSRQDYEGALADADAALAVDPKSSDALVIRAVALLGLQRVDEAGEAIEAAAMHFEESGLGLAESPRFCAVRATFAKEKKELDRAEAIFEECLEEYPINFLVVDEAVKFFDGLGRPERSLEIMRKAYEEAPTFRSYRLSLAYRLTQAGEDEEAEALLKDATGVASPALAASAWADLASYYFGRERLDDAIVAFEEALARVPDPGAEFFFAYADALVAAERYDRALELADGMTVKPHRELIRGRVALARGEPESALEHFTAGLALWPDNAVARYFAAIAAEQVGELDRAVEEYRYSIRADAGASDARLRLARLYMAQGDDGAALEVLRHEAERKPGHGDVYVLLELELLARLGRGDSIPPRLQAAIRPPAMWPRAVAALARGARATRGAGPAARIVLKADRLDLTAPANAAALASLVEDLAALERTPAAHGRIDAALAAHPDAAVFHALKGKVLVLTGGEEESARAAFARALEIDADQPDALLGLARIEAASGATDEALALYRRAEAADPEDTEALREAAGLLAEAERGAEAEQALDRLLARDPYDGAGALALARLLLERGDPAVQPRAVALLHRAARFGEKAEAERLLAGVEKTAGAS